MLIFVLLHLLFFSFAFSQWFEVDTCSRHFFSAISCLLRSNSLYNPRHNPSFLFCSYISRSSSLAVFMSTCFISFVSISQPGLQLSERYSFFTLPFSWRYKSILASFALTFTKERWHHLQKIKPRLHTFTKSRSILFAAKHLYYYSKTLLRFVSLVIFDNKQYFS